MRPFKMTVMFIPYPPPPPPSTVSHKDSDNDMTTTVTMVMTMNMTMTMGTTITVTMTTHKDLQTVQITNINFVTFHAIPASGDYRHVMGKFRFRFWLCSLLTPLQPLHPFL